MKEKLSGFLTIVLVLCALTVTGLVVRREFAGPAPAAVFAQGYVVDGWEALLDAGPATEREVRLVVFTDYTCTYCLDFEHAVDSLRAVYGERLEVRHRHFPRAAGKTAFQAAVAAECAAQEHGLALHRALFAHQAVLGSTPWSAIAAAAGIPEPDAFAKCVREEHTAAAVLADRARGEALGVVGTPTFLVNGRLYLGSRSFAELERLARLPGGH